MSHHGRCWDCSHTAPLDDDGCCTRCGVSQELSYRPNTAEQAVRRVLSYFRLTPATFKRIS